MAARPVADLREVEPNHAVGGAQIVDLPAEELERAAVIAFVRRDRVEVLREPFVRAFPARRLKNVGALEHAQPIVD